MPVVVVALPALADILLALLLVVVGVLISAVIVPPLVALIRNLPAIGGQLADAIQRWSDDLQRSIQGNLDRSVQTITDTIDMITGRFQDFINTVSGFLDWSAGKLGEALGTLGTLAVFTTDAINHLTAAAVKAAADIGKALARSVAVAADLAGAIAQTIPRMIAQAVAAAQDWVRGRLDDVRKAILSVVAALEAGLLDALGQERLARRAGEATLRGDLGKGLSDLERGLEADLGRLGDVIGDAIDGLERDLSGLRDLVGPIAAGTVVGLITEVITKVTDLERDCIRPGCDFLGPQLDSLNGIGDAITLGAVTALIAAAARDPEGAARTTLEWTSGPARVAEGMIGALTGVAA